MPFLVDVVASGAAWFWYGLLHSNKVSTCKILTAISLHANHYSLGIIITLFCTKFRVNKYRLHFIDETTF